MSVSTPILTTSSESCAFAAVPEAAKARPAASKAVSDFIVLLPGLLLRASVEGLPSSIRLDRLLQTEDLHARPQRRTEKRPFRTPARPRCGKCHPASARMT